MSSSVQWKALVQQSKQATFAERIDVARQILSALKSASASDAPLDAPVQPLLVNALLHLLHAPRVSPAESSADSAASSTEENPSMLALDSLAVLLSHPALVSHRVAIIVRKLDEFRGQARATPEVMAAIDQLLALHPELAASVRTESAAAAAAGGDDSAAERKAARIAKEQRKQADAAEKRKIKAQSLAASGCSRDAAASSMAACDAGIAAVAATAVAASSSSSSPDVRDGSESAPFGNFHTYYRFNPIAERLRFIPSQLAVDILRRKQHRGNKDGSGGADRFAFLDVGCNEGDLTIGLMKHLLAGLRGESDEPTVASVDARAAAASPAAQVSPVAPVPSSAPFSSSSASSAPFSSVQLHAIGVDIDPELISRAQGKVSPSLDSVASHFTSAAATPGSHATPLPTLRFEAIDVMQPASSERILGLLASSVASVAAASSATAAAAASSSSDAASTPALTASPTPASPARPFDLVCVYSITMWIHLHHGDAGLRLFLSRLARLTTNLILEPQPWRCYLTARERWRRCGKADPPMMVSLEWRNDVQERMIEFITNDKEVGMRLRADLGSTKWQRRVLWFERAEEPQLGTHIEQS